MTLSQLFQLLAQKRIQVSVAAGKLNINAAKGAMTPEIMAALKTHKEALIEALSVEQNSAPVLAVTDRSVPLPLSFAQQSLWLLDKIDSGNAHYNINSTLTLKGALNIRALSAALGIIVERHESLRTVFVANQDGEPAQLVQAYRLFEIAMIDLSDMAGESLKAKVTAAVQEEAEQGFDLSADLMLRARLLKTAPDTHILIITMHHIASDGWSINVLVKELSQLYRACIKGLPNPLAPLAIQYGDYAHWQRRWLSGEVLDKQLQYWQRQLANLPQTHSLPLDRPRPKQQSFRGDSVYSNIGAQTGQTLKRLCQAQDASLFMGLHAAFSALLWRISGEQDIVLGSPVANRQQEQLAPVIGYFVNTLVLRSNLGGEPNFAELIGRSKTMLSEAYRHQQVPFEQLVERLSPERSLSHSPLFQIMLVLQNDESGSLTLPGLTLATAEQADNVAKFELTLSISEKSDGLALTWQYSSDLFNRSTIERMAEHFSALLSALVTKPNVPVSEANLFTPQLQQQLLVDWNDSITDTPLHLCVHQLFEQQVEATPELVAVSADNGSTQQITYDELNRQANQLAHYLIAQKQVKPDTLVGVCLERSVDIIIAIMAVLKSGAAYVPLDPDYPSDRLAYMVKDAGLKTLITRRKLLDKTGATEAQAVFMDKAPETVFAHMSQSNVAVAGLTSSNLAYVIYTSGSTGNPKGVMVEHRSLVNIIAYDCRLFDIQPADRFLHCLSLGFDAGNGYMLETLCGGACLVLEPNLDNLFELIKAKSITHVTLPPALLNLQQISDTHSLKAIITGGDVFDHNVINKLSANTQLFNAYGPTETTVSSTCLQVARGRHNETGVIGAPIANTECFVLDEQMGLLPAGSFGELYIGGVGVARGYLNRPDLTAERFVRNPFYDPANLASSQYLYKTGDLVRWLPDADGRSAKLVFAGRMDTQVKLRGFRIELGEIENTLTTAESVKDAIVEVKTINDDKRLVAYVVAKDHELVDDAAQQPEQYLQRRQQAIADIREHLAMTLPEHMMPSLFVFMAALPLTPNGKVDRKAMPMPRADLEQRHFVAPMTDTQQLLCQVWQEILDVEQVGISDNFFELGGHSLLVIKAINKLQQFDIRMSAPQLFAAPTVAGLAQLIDSDPADEIAVFKAPDNLIEANCEKITPQMLPLVALSEAEIANVCQQVAGGAANIEDIYPLGALQQGILFHHRLHPQADPYVSAFTLKIDNRSSLNRLLAGLQLLVDRHDVLRTAILWEGLSEPVQVVCRHLELSVSYIVPDKGRDELAELEAQADPSVHGMDLTKPPLIKVKVVGEPDRGQHYVLLQLHHIVSDHIGLEIIQNELGQIINGQAHELKTPVPYREFIAHCAELARRHDAEAYFRSALGDLDEPSAPYDLLDVKGDGSNMNTAKLAIDDKLASDLAVAARASGVSPAVLFHAAWAMVVSRCSDRDDIVFGSVMSGRLQGMKDAQSMLGVFINTLAVRVKLQHENAAQLVSQIQQLLQQLLPFEQTPLALAQRCSGLDSDTPLFTALLNYRHSGDPQNAARLMPKGIEFLQARERTNYPFNLNVDDRGGSFDIGVQTAAPICAHKVAGYVHQALSGLIEALNTASEQPVQLMEMIGEDEANRLLAANQNRRAYPNHQSIAEVFAVQCDQTPDAVAVSCHDGKLSYRQLDGEANRLARYLVAHVNLQPGERVGVLLPRSVETIVALLAIVKAGGTYVPLDTNGPDARLAGMISQAGLATLITCGQASALHHEQSICLDSAREQIAAMDSSNFNQSAGGDSVAYIMFTSGSTGQPKGVKVSHKAVVSLVVNNDYVPLGQQTIMMQNAPVAFDASTFEIWGALLNGGQLVIQPEPVPEIAALEAFINRHNINTAWLTAALFDQLATTGQATDSCLSYLLVGGDIVKTASVASFQQRHRAVTLINGYGPTENTTFSCCHTIASVTGCGRLSIPIGRPLANRQVYVLDHNRMLVPEGVCGELYVGGDGLAEGYLGQPELTALTFVENPFKAGEKLYRTGDRVCWQNGLLMFMGRMDHQIKIRGFRVEPGEVEQLLVQHCDIREAAVVARKTLNGEDQLIAYFSADLAPATQALEQYLAEQLPTYMLPSAFVLLSELPLTANGKVDRKALPEPDLALTGETYEAPSNEVELQLCAIWQELLGIERVGVSDNFFRLGGHSLLATRLVSQINQTFAVNLGLQQVFSEATVRRQARAIAQVSGASLPPALTSAKQEGCLPLSFTQQRLWLIDALEGSSHYNIPMALELTGRLDIAALETAFALLIERHGTLRTVFATNSEDKPVQLPQPVGSFNLGFEDLSAMSDEARQSHLQQQIGLQSRCGFDLGCDLMLRAAVLKLATDRHVLLITIHHIASDGWSMGILTKELVILYRALVKGEPAELEPLPLQYTDFAVWQRNWLQGEVLQSQLGYWTQQLADLPAVHALPLDNARPKQQRFVGQTHTSHIAKDSVERLYELCLGEGATLFMGLNALFAVLLCRYSGESDIVLGTPVANREQAEIANLIGFFANTLVLRNDVSGDPSFVTVLQRSKAMLLEAYAHQQVPFELVVEALQPARNLGYSPLFQVMLVLQNNDSERLQLPGLEINALAQQSHLAKFDLTLNVVESKDGLMLTWQYNCDLFGGQTIARMAEHFERLLAGLVKDPNASINAIDMLGETEREQLISWSESMPAPMTDKRSLAGVFEAQVEIDPKAIALVAQGQHLSYGELNTKANQLAHWLLQHHNIKPDIPVGVCLEPSIEMVIALLAISKAGGAFVPLDPQFPSARLAMMIDDAGMTIVLTHRHLADSLGLDERLLCFADECVHPLKDNPCRADLRASHLAYLLYTSGTTGRPKGVMIEHHNVISHLLSQQHCLGIDNDEVFILLANYVFDAAVEQIFLPLCSGARLVLPNKAQLENPEQIKALLVAHQVTHLHGSPAYLAMLAGLPAGHRIRRVMSGGDVMAAKVREQYGELLINRYGPTETTITCVQNLEFGPEQPLNTIGKPMPGNRVAIMNEQMQLVPIGVVGELYVGGSGIARGYLNLKQQTAERFVVEPQTQTRWYKTGDRVKWQQGGMLEFIGREDGQVKIRGLRIETGEIEYHLGQSEQISDALVLAKGEGDDKRLVAYLVTPEAKALEQADLRREFTERLVCELGQSLPHYMVPAQFVLLAQWPLNAGGKIDKTRLLQLDDGIRMSGYVAPQNEMQRQLCELWLQLLPVEKVGISDNFFELGGHSLLATRLVSRINKAFGSALALKTLFERPTIEQIATLLSDKQPVINTPIVKATEHQSLIPLSFAQHRLWLLSQIEGGNAHYNMPLAFTLSGNLHREALASALSEIIRRHHSLRTCFVTDSSGEPSQRLNPVEGFTVQYHDLCSLEQADRQALIAQHQHDEATQPFDLSVDLMIRARLLAVSADEHVLLLTVHHIACDGWSMTVLLKEFNTLYSAMCQGEPAQLQPLEVQYTDYALWQHNELKAQGLVKAEEYWTQQLADLPLMHSLPLDRPRPARQSFSGQTHTSRLPESLLHKLTSVCQGQGATLFMGLHGAFSALLSRLSNEHDIVMGTPIANREQQQVENLIGLFMNTLVLRANLADNPAFAELVGQSKTMLLDAYAHQQLPFEQLVSRLQPQRSLSHSPLFQVMLVMHNNESGQLALPGVSVAPLGAGDEVAKYDLTLNVKHDEDGLLLGWQFSDALFNLANIEQMAANFEILLEAMVNQPQTGVLSLAMLDKQQSDWLLNQCNRTAADFATPGFVHQQFQMQVANSPEATALVCDNQRLSYRQLDAKANQLAHYLIEHKQVGPDRLVGVCLTRSVEMVVAILAIMKAGGAYVPLDPGYPKARLQHMVEDAELTVVLCERRFVAASPINLQLLICVDDPVVESQLAGQPEHSPQLPLLQPHHLAYVIYTSGSTGLPKGVMIEHRQLDNFVNSMQAKLECTEQDVLLAVTSISFDIHTLEIFLPLIGGATVVVANDRALADADALKNLLEHHQISMMQATPSTWQMMLDAQWRSSRPMTLLCGGEPLSADLKDGLLHNDNITLWNMYGPTETCVWSTMAKMQRGLPVTLGTPVGNTHCYVVNEQLQLCPAGSCGELLIGGAGVARGYHNNPQLSAQRFIADPFAAGRVYKTGDLVKQSTDGQLVYIGRMDEQVKLRGYRIEPGEIEHQLQRCPLVDSALVAVKSRGQGLAQLVAWVQPATTVAGDFNQTETSAQISEFIRQSLPVFMMPTVYVYVSQWPLKPNGKIDRQALPSPEENLGERMAPQNEIERSLVELWSNLLGLSTEHISTTDNFFELGGSSLLVVRLKAGIEQVFNVSFELNYLFEAPSLTDMANNIGIYQVSQDLQDVDEDLLDEVEF